MSKPVNEQIIDRATELVNTRWTRGTFARDHLGKPVNYFDLAAESFCALGALYRSTYEVLGEKQTSAFVKPLICEIDTIAIDEYRRPITAVNDYESKSEVLVCFAKLKEKLCV